MFDFNLQFARNGAEFTVELFQQLAAGDIKENIFFSPFSVQLCVALAFAGAEGKTAEQIVQGLKLVSNCEPEVSSTFQFVLDKYKTSTLLKIANKIYVQEGKSLNAEYHAITKKCYDAEAESVNFAESQTAANAINKWVTEKTAGKIEEIVTADSLGDNTRLLLLNALHFKGKWAEQFNENHTVEGSFWISKTESVKVHYMNKKAKYGWGYFKELNCSALEMPYKDSDLSMLVLLPNEREGLKHLASKLKTVNLVDLADTMITEEVVVKFPKFTVNYTVELTEVLKRLGMDRMFSDEAEFGKMLKTPEPLSVSNVYHKACIEVNEEGTEAAAATVAVMMTRMLMMQLLFEADHPFLYIIWNKKNIMFAGAFVNAPNN